MSTATPIHPQYAIGTWKLDKAHSELAFSVRHLGISRVRGVFHDFDVTIETAEDYRDSTIEATIELASVDTKEPNRDGHLKTGDFFKIDEFPTATFRSTRIEGTPEDFTVTGDLTLRGVTKPITLQGEFGGINTDGNGRVHAGAEVRTTIDRTEFGVSWNSPLEAGGFVLANDVTLSFDLQVILQR